MYAEGTVVGGRYRLIRKIGEGGMATIWEAEHQTLGSPVAVKFLQWQGPQSEQIRERFLREARVAASVRHRNVVEITDFGLTDDKTPYIVMEMLRGESLADKLDREGRLEAVEASRLASLTLRGLAVVHEKGIVHRDLKPENIFIVDDPDGTYPKLLDFGVSKRATEPGAKNLTQEGMIVGTPEYMSPEQARGLRDVDSRTDIYSMGVILYEMLTGRLPYESENIGDLIVMITTQPPTPITHYAADLSQHLIGIVETALQKNREDRYPSARDMRWALIEAFRGDGFGDVDSGVTGVSELPPPPDGWGTGSFARPLPETPPEGSSRAIAVGAPHPTPSAPFERPPQLRNKPSQPRMALGAPPTPALGLPAAVPEEQKKKSGGKGLLIGAVIGVLALGVAGIVIYQQRVAGSDGDEQPEAAGAPWEPTSESTFLDVDAGPFADAGETVSVVVRDLPRGSKIRIAEVPIRGRRANVPLAPGDYPVEVLDRSGTTVWRVDHPGYTDGEYQVWRMSGGEIPDGGLGGADASAEVERDRGTKRRRPRRGNRRRRR